MDTKSIQIHLGQISHKTAESLFTLHSRRWHELPKKEMNHNWDQNYDIPYQSKFNYFYDHCVEALPLTSPSFTAIKCISVTSPSRFCTASFSTNS